MQNKFIKLGTLLIFLVAAYVFLIVGVRPFVEDIASSDLFLVVTDDPAKKYFLLENEKTRLALIHCNQYFQENFDVETTAEPTENDYRAYALGNYSYMINATIDGFDSNGSNVNHKIVCKIQYMEGDELKYENWEVTQFNFG